MHKCGGRAGFLFDLSWPEMFFMFEGEVWKNNLRPENSYHCDWLFPMEISVHGEEFWISTSSSFFEWWGGGGGDKYWQKVPVDYSITKPWGSSQSRLQNSYSNCDDLALIRPADPGNCSWCFIISYFHYCLWHVPTAVVLCPAPCAQSSYRLTYIMLNHPYIMLARGGAEKPLVGKTMCCASADIRKIQNNNNVCYMLWTEPKYWLCFGFHWHISNIRLHVVLLNTLRWW